MKKTFEILFLSLCLISLASAIQKETEVNENEEDVDDFLKRLDINSLLANATRKPLKEYKNADETPNSTVFLNTDTIKVKQPCIFGAYDVGFNYSSDPLGSGLTWNEKRFRTDIMNLLVYGKSYEYVRNARDDLTPSLIKRKTNLAKFLHQMDEYASETSLEFNIPFDVRLLINLPNILDNENLRNRFEKVTMKISLNFDTYSFGIKNDEFDQLICSMSEDTLSILTFDLANLNNIRTSNGPITLSETVLNQNECIYIPINWIYSLRTKQNWLYSIAWLPLNETIQEIKVESTKNDSTTKPILTTKKLNDVYFKSDMKEPIIQYISHFLGYFVNGSVVHDIQIERKQFIEKIKLDPMVNKGIINCDQKCEDITIRLFRMIDIDSDGVLSLNDFEQLDQKQAVKLNEKIEKLTESYLSIQAEQLANLKKMFDDLQAKSPDIDIRKQLNEMFRTKMNEWYADLPEAEKLALKEKNIDLDNLVDTLLPVKGDERTGGQSERDSIKKKLKAENAEKQKNRQKTGPNDSIFDNEDSSDRDEVEEEIDEIFADADEAIAQKVESETENPVDQQEKNEL